MEDILLEILDELRTAGRIDALAVESIVRKHNKALAVRERRYAKKHLFPYYLKTKESDKERWGTWNVDDELEKLLVQALQVKPRRTASGVATITVITKPWKCASTCLYCPSDLRMPKSYLSDEPACQRAERNCFDPYLQVAVRLRTLKHMGHVTDKIELIVLGGTWDDYPQAYRIWFVKELFRALNEADDERAEREIEQRRTFYENAGIGNEKEELLAFTAEAQREVERGTMSYNQAMANLYGKGPWKAIGAQQAAVLDELDEQHARNERAAHRVVGLVIETRPDTITSESLALIRRLGCTKVQIGVQSLDNRILALNNRGISTERIQEAFALLRLFGFKIHAHFMANLYGSTPEDDKRDYLRLVDQAPYLPDEVKLYPCALVANTGLCTRFEDGSWHPYSEEELLDVLIADVLATPPYVRISRMIRDFSSHDIVAGNKKVNLRQLVERRLEASGDPVAEIRYREISTSETDIGELSFETVAYETVGTSERFLQWVTADGRIAGFLRLSLPDPQFVTERQADLPVGPHEAMIREVHVYGKAAELHKTGKGVQHLGLGKQLVEKACAVAREAGYDKINVISSVGTREYYRALGFADKGLYQQRPLD